MRCAPGTVHSTARARRPALLGCNTVRHRQYTTGRPGKDSTVFLIHRAPAIRYEQGALLHTAANQYRCSDPECPCSSGQTEVQITPTTLFTGANHCAWCLDAAGLQATQNESHGICEKHSRELLALAKERRARRKGGAL